MHPGPVAGRVDRPTRQRLLVLNIRQPQSFSVVTSLGIIMICTAYLLVTAPMLVARLRGGWQSAGGGRFSLGRWGLPVNAVAVLWGAAMIVNVAWPRDAVYNAAPPYHWYLRWGGVLFVGLVALGGFAYYWCVQRHRTGVLAEHAARPVGPDGDDTDTDTAFTVPVHD